MQKRTVRAFVWSALDASLDMLSPFVCLYGLCAALTLRTRTFRHWYVASFYCCLTVFYHYRWLNPHLTLSNSILSVRTHSPLCLAWATFRVSWRRVMFRSPQTTVITEGISLQVSERDVLRPAPFSFTLTCLMSFCTSSFSCSRVHWVHDMLFSLLG